MICGRYHRALARFLHNTVVQTHGEVFVAEINITEKRRSWMPWILGGIVVAAIIWFMSVQNNSNANTAGRTGAYDTNNAAGTLAAPRDSAAIRSDSLLVPPPR